MADVVDPATRSRMMSGIRSKNTKPELQIRSAMHRLGFRFRLNQASHQASQTWFSENIMLLFSFTDAFGMAMTVHYSSGHLPIHPFGVTKLSETEPRI